MAVIIVVCLLPLPLLFNVPSCSATADGVLTDNPHLVLLFYMAQLFLRELVKSYRLIQVVPMDMSGYYGKFTSAIYPLFLIVLYIPHGKKHLFQLRC